MVDLIVSAIADMITDALDAFIEAIMPLFAFDFDSFARVFPFAANAYGVLQQFSLGLALILAAWQLIPFILNTSQSKASPLRTVMLTVLAVGGIYYGNYVLEWIIAIADVPYRAILELNSSSTGVYGLGGVKDGTQALSYVLSSYFTGASVLLYIILLLMVAIAFVKLLLEAVERYVVLFVLVYLSPLAFATMASESSFGVFKKFFTMFISQCILLILTIWSVEMGISMLGNLDSAPGSPVIGLLMGYAFLRIAGRIDSYLNQLGLNAAVTGLGIGNELMATGMMMMSRLGGKAGGIVGGGAGGSKGGGGIAGAANKITKGLKSISPFQPAVNYANAAVKSAVGSGVAGAKAWANKLGSGGALAAGKKAAAASLSKGLSQNMRNAKLTNQGTNLFSRGIYSKIRGAVKPGDLTNSDMANHPFFAAQAFNTIPDGGANNDPAASSAIMEGEGLRDVDPRFGEAIDVGNGLLGAENVDFTHDANGISGSYDDLHGKHNEFSVKNAQQFGALAPELQKGYTEFTTPGGETQYARFATSRALTPMQKEQVAAQERFAAVLANPNASLSPADRDYMRRNPGSLQQYVETIPQGSVSPIQAANVLGSFEVSGNRQIKSAFDQIVSSPDATSSYREGDALVTDYTDRNGKPGCLIYSPTPLEGYDNTMVRGVDGSKAYMCVYDYSQIAMDSVTMPNPKTPVTTEQLSECGKRLAFEQRAMVDQAASYLEENDTRLEGEAALGHALLTVNNLSPTAISLQEKAELVNALSLGQVSNLVFDGNGLRGEYKNPDNGHSHHFDIVTHVPASGDEASSFHNKGYSVSPMGSRNFAYLNTEMDPDGNIVTGKKHNRR